MPTSKQDKILKRAIKRSDIYSVITQLAAFGQLNKKYKTKSKKLIRKTAKFGTAFLSKGLKGLKAVTNVAKVATDLEAAVKKKAAPLALKATKVAEGAQKQVAAATKVAEKQVVAAAKLAPVAALAKLPAAAKATAAAKLAPVAALTKAAPLTKAAQSVVATVKKEDDEKVLVPTQARPAKFGAARIATSFKRSSSKSSEPSEPTPLEWAVCEAKKEHGLSGIDDLDYNGVVDKINEAWRHDTLCEDLMPLIIDAIEARVPGAKQEETVPAATPLKFGKNKAVRKTSKFGNPELSPCSPCDAPPEIIEQEMKKRPICDKIVKTVLNAERILETEPEDAEAFIKLMRSLPVKPVTPAATPLKFGKKKAVRKSKGKGKSGRRGGRV